MSFRNINVVKTTITKITKPNKTNKQKTLLWSGPEVAQD